MSRLSSFMWPQLQHTVEKLDVLSSARLDDARPTKTVSTFTPHLPWRRVRPLTAIADHGALVLEFDSVVAVTSFAKVPNGGCEQLLSVAVACGSPESSVERRSRL